jgi:hypothetical protein
MSLTGTIGTISLPGLLQLLSGEQKSGIFSVRQSDMEFQIFFSNGKVVHATQSQKAARLGELLINDKHITPLQLELFLAISVKKKQALGKTLVENNLITETILKRYLYIQAEEIVFGLFCMNAGDFSYKGTKFDMRWLIPAEINTLRLVMDALQRLDDNSFDESVQAAIG